VGTSVRFSGSVVGNGTATGSDADNIDLGDAYGDYTGSFTVALFEGT